MKLNPTDLLPEALPGQKALDYVECAKDFTKFKSEGASISAVANAAALAGVEYGIKVWGYDPKKERACGTSSKVMREKKDGVPFSSWLSKQLGEDAVFSFGETAIDGKRVVALAIKAPVRHPVMFKKNIWILEAGELLKVEPGSQLESKIVERFEAKGAPDGEKAGPASSEKTDPPQVGNEDNETAEVEALVEKAKAEEPRDAAASSAPDDNAEKNTSPERLDARPDASAPKKRVGHGSPANPSAKRSAHAAEKPAEQADWFERGIAIAGLSRTDILDLLDWQGLYQIFNALAPQDITAINDQLAKIGMIIKEDDRRFAITNLGALVLANDLTQFSRLARYMIKIVRYRGPRRIERMNEQVFSSGYAISIDQACEFVSSFYPEGNPYPLAALRELIANAAAHQSFGDLGDGDGFSALNSSATNPSGPLIEVFSDRIEVSNIGTLGVDPNMITAEEPQPVNRFLATLLGRLRPHELHERGWLAIIESCELNNAPIPQLRALEPSRLSRSPRVCATVKASAVFKKWTPEQRLDACYWHACARYARGETLSNGSLRERFDVEISNSAQISRLIKEASSMGLIKPVEANAAPKFRRYLPIWA